jgi:hypothetical protein
MSFANLQQCPVDNSVDEGSLSPWEQPGARFLPGTGWVTPARAEGHAVDASSAVPSIAEARARLKARRAGTGEGRTEGAEGEAGL